MLAKSPPSMIGKIGRIQAGVMLWIVRRRAGAENKCRYCNTAEMKASDTYIQSVTLIAVANQGPQYGDP